MSDAVIDRLSVMLEIYSAILRRSVTQLMHLKTASNELELTARTRQISSSRLLPMQRTRDRKEHGNVNLRKTECLGARAYFCMDVFNMTNRRLMRNTLTKSTKRCKSAVTATAAIANAQENDCIMAINGNPSKVLKVDCTVIDVCLDVDPLVTPLNIALWVDIEPGSFLHVTNPRESPSKLIIHRMIQILGPKYYRLPLS